MKKFVKLCLAGILCLSTAVSSNCRIWAQEDSKITNITAEGKSSSGHEPALAIDGNINTYYMTPSSNSMDDHYRNIDLTLDGLYELSKIKIYNNEGSYNHYQIYASTDGVNYDKIAYKNDDAMANANGDEYIVDVEASHIRINLSYNSNQMEGNLAEVELFGDRIGEAVDIEDKINEVANFEDTEWADEYQKVANDQEYANNKTIKEMSALVGRVIGDEWQDSFIFEMRDSNDDKDIFEIENGANGKIIIRGNNGIAMASGFNHYLRYYCNVDYNPVFVSQLKMPETLPQLDSKIVKETQYDYRYALNFCTYSYTMAFWDWDDYEVFLDWAAMSGINTMLDIVGQEEVIRRTLSAYGYSDDEIKEYICGPGYFAWFYMQNMTSYGGKLPNNWFENRVELGRKMHDRMQTYGITPVLSGFSGQVPTNFKNKYSDVQYVAQGNWCGYERPDMLRTYVDNGGKDYFSEMADIFYQAQRDTFGDITDIYAVDPFHEGGKIGDMNYTKVYETVQKKMMENDENAIWLIQEWSGSIAGNTSKLTNLDKNHVIVLDLFSEVSPRNSALEGASTPWIWNMLHNFGGRMGLDANPEKVSQNIPNTYQNSNYMVGIGMTPEAIENSPMAYELLWDMTWSKDPIDFRQWSQDYAKRIYGGTNEDIEEVWNILLETGYNRKDSYYQGAPESVINARPTTNFTSASSWGHSTINYDKEKLERAVYLLAKNHDEFKDSPAFIYDLSDITRQLISNSAQEYHAAMVSAYQNGNLAEFEILSDKFLEMILLQDQILSTNSDFLVGNWIEKARTMLDDSDDWTKDLFEFNARDLITTWGGLKNANGGGLRDYSNRQWAGITKDYYYPRWQKWIEDVKTAMETGSAVATTNWFLMEWQWANEKSDEGNDYSTTPANLDLSQLAMKAYNDYSISSLKQLVGNVEEKENIALGKNVSASINSLVSNPTTNLTDGNKETAWVGESNVAQFDLTVDLEEESSIDGMEIALKQVAGGFPYSYKVEVFEKGEWKVVAENNDGQITSQTLIDYKGIASKVKFTFTTTDTTIIPEVTELLIYGKVAQKVNYKNLAAGIPVTTPEGVTDKITDENTSSLWVRNGDKYPALLTLDLGEEAYVDVLELYFEKPGLRYQYDVVIEDASGNQTVIQDKSDNTEDLAGMYKLPVNQMVQKVYVNLKARAQGGEFYLAWPALAEIKLLQETELEFEYQNIAYGKPGHVINKNSYDTSKLTDGSISGLENVGHDDFPTTFQVDLGSDQFIEEVKIYFEKPGIRFKYKVEVEDTSGNKTVIMDMTDNLDDMQSEYTIPAKVSGSKVNVVIEGRAPGGSFYLASPAMTEIEVFAKPSNVISDSEISANISLSDEQKKALVDNDNTTSVEFDSNDEKEIVFAFEKPVDIYAYELYKLSNEALQYKIEYLSVDDSEWSVLIDESNNLKDSKKYVEEFNAVLASKIRLTIYNDSAEISGFNVYRHDATIELASYITTLKNNLAKFTIGEYAGDYAAAAKQVLENIIGDAESKLDSNINSLEVLEEQEKLEKAYNEFLRSYISIDRTPLLVELDEVNKLLKLESLKDNENLNDAYDSAKAIYNTYKVTQNELDACKETLQAAKEEALSLLSNQEIYQEKLAVANKLIEDTGIGEYNGNVSKETMDSLINAVNKAENDYVNVNTAGDLNIIISDLINAIELFENNKIIVDKTALQEAIDKTNKLNEDDYTKESWQKVDEALQMANKVNEENSSLSEVENAKNALLEAIDNLIDADLEVETNKIALQMAVDTANTLKAQGALDNVVPAVVNEFEAALKEAAEVLADKSVSQTTVDTSFYRLTNAIHMLEFVKGDKTALEALINEANNYVEENYTPDSWTAFKEALDAAIEVMNDENALEADVVEALNNLKDAMTSLVIRVDKTRLQEAYDKVNGLDKSLYTEGSVANLAEPMTNAKAVLEDPNATQTEVDSAYKALIEAYLNLRLIPNKNLLQGLINKANSLNAANYSAKTWSVMAEALEKANAVLDDPEATQEEVDNAKEVLTKAMAGLEVNEASNPVKAGDTTVSVATGDNGLIGIYASLSVLAVAGLSLLRKKNY